MAISAAYLYSFYLRKMHLYIPLSFYSALAGACEYIIGKGNEKSKVEDFADVLKEDDTEVL